LVQHFRVTRSFTGVRRKVYLKQGKVTMKNFQEIRTVLQEHAQELQNRYQISNLAVFGSMVRGETREDSDVDIIADVPENMSLLGVISAENYLSDIVGMKVDFIPRSDIRRELRDHILTEAVAI
jgi:predicted nucleotidyltransferase